MLLRGAGGFRHSIAYQSAPDDRLLEYVIVVRRIKVGMVVFPGFQLLDIAGPRDAFAEVGVLSRGEFEYDMLTVGTTGGTILSSNGLAVVPDCTISDPTPDFDTVIVPGAHGIFDAYDAPALSAWLGQQYRRARGVSSICNGIFALGAAGLIDDRTVTTHWMDVPRLAATFPKARIEPDNIFVKDGRIYTTAGVVAGIDLSLAMIEEDFGRKLAFDVAKYLIINLRREGWQSQFSPMLECDIVLERQIDALMRSAIEHSGALILWRGPEQRIMAEVRIRGDTVTVQLQDEPATAALLPQSVLRHVVNARESVILDDAAAESRFSADPYISERQPRSIFCEPLITQSKLIGVLYLESNLAPGVFVPARIAMLKLLGSQAAIALENARLIRDLGEREAKVRRLVDANIIGIIVWDFHGPILEANDAFLQIVGYDREDLIAGPESGRPNAARIARRSEAASPRRAEGDGSPSSLRDRVRAQRRQPRPRSGRRGRIRCNRESRRYVRARLDGAPARGS